MSSVAKRIVFGALLGLIVIAAIPYGTVEPWWKAAFVCAVFAICIVALIESLREWFIQNRGWSDLLPMLALSALAFIQTLSLGSLEVAGFSVWNTSAPILIKRASLRFKCSL